jgi:hypothetical protein
MAEGGGIEGVPGTENEPRDSEASAASPEALALALAMDSARHAGHDTGLVVEPFTVPPDLAQRGLTGQVVAKQVLDRLSELQQQTFSDRPANAYRNSWGDGLKVEIPETGIAG